MSEALQFFLNDSRICNSLDYPDEGIDYVFMLEPEEWSVIVKEWDNRSVDWKIAISYFGGFIRLEASSQILIKAVEDHDENVVEQGLFSIFQSIKEEMEEEGLENTSFTFPKIDRDKIVNQILKRKMDFDEFPEYEELMDLLFDNSK